MKYVLLFLTLLPGGALAPVPNAPVFYFNSLSVCEETRDHRVVQESYRGIYGPDLVMVCAPVGR